MKPQKPADGIMLAKDFGHSKFYTVACDCGNPDDDIRFEVESDELNVCVNMWTTQYTSWPHVDINHCFFSSNCLFDLEYKIRSIIGDVTNRLKYAFQIIFFGYIKYSQSTILSEQQATNFAHTLLNAVIDVKTFKRPKSSTPT